MSFYSQIYQWRWEQIESGGAIIIKYLYKQKKKVFDICINLPKKCVGGGAKPPPSPPVPTPMLILSSLSIWNMITLTLMINEPMKLF